MAGSQFDLVVIGGGVNGCGIARDAAGRGLSVLLCEQEDLGAATSSASTKLIHGGLRYLEQYDFRLVHESLAEREVLLRSAPHIISPLRFVLPHHSGLRPWPIIRIGLFIYDHLGGRTTLPGTRGLDLARDVAGRPLKPSYTRAFEYSDCWVDDARLVVLNARDAADRGAEIRTRRRCIAARREGGLWRVTLHDPVEPTRYESVSARALVNAAGPWVSEVATGVAGENAPVKVRLVKGSHLVVDRLYEHDRAYIFQNADGRVCFAIPYEGRFTLIGTTDVDFTGDALQAAISEEETVYLMAAANEYFAQPVTRQMIRSSYAGVRPLYDDGATAAQEATRDYMLHLDAPEGAPPMLSIYGGKITTHRRLAEHAMEKLAPTFPDMRGPWTKSAHLPGGDFQGKRAQFIAEMQKQYAGLEPSLVARLARAYGTQIEAVLDGARSPDDLGRDFGMGLTEREIDYLVAREWAASGEDVLWRRSKVGLHIDAAAAQAVADYTESRVKASKGLR